MSIGRRHHVILDAADPWVEARFWSAVLGQPITYSDEQFVVVAESDHHSGLAFQRSPGHVAPVWPGAHGEQQSHLDVMVETWTRRPRQSPHWAPDRCPAAIMSSPTRPVTRSASSADRAGRSR